MPKTSTWKILNKYPENPIKAILKSRKIDDEDAFVSPSYDDLVDPFLIPGMKEAVKRIKKATEKNEKVGVFMDYDADGIPGGTIIYKALNNLGLEVFPYVPRREDGYGVNIEAVDKFKKLGVSLMVTVDCGIRNLKEIKRAKEIGIETIVTDHHELGAELPSSINVHPLITLKNKMKFRDFSGGGVAFLLAKALSKKPGQEKWLLDLAAISSVADVVTLRSDNRLIVKFGLVVLNKTRNLGLSELIKIAGIKFGKIGTYEIGYMIAPRINAAGRVSHPEKSFRLLTTEDPKEARELANELNDLNVERQDALEVAQTQAEKDVEKQKLFENKIIIVKNRNWPEGIIGLVAGKLVQKYYRPVIALNERDGKMKGSARSIPGINVTDLIGESAKHLVSFGGHEQAAGLLLEEKNYLKFEKSILNNAQNIDDKLYQKSFVVDALVEVDQVNMDLARKLERLEPFGPGNKRPIFALESVKIVEARYVGREEKHLRLKIEKSNQSHHIIAFYFENNGFDIRKDDIYDLAFSVKAGEFNGEKKLDLILESANLASRINEK